MYTRIAAGIVSCVAAVLFGTTLAQALMLAPQDDLVATNTSASDTVSVHAGNVSNDLPDRLIIPSLNIDADVQNVGITKKGNMSVPNNYSQVGWYKYGPRPGEAGSAVMAGHVDNALALPGVFKYLEDIQVGDDVYVRNKNGKLLHFVVEETDTFSVEDAPAGKIFDLDSPPMLNLVTCAGDWVQSEHQYDHRFVVYARLVDEP